MYLCRHITGIANIKDNKYIQITVDIILYYF